MEIDFLFGWPGMVASCRRKLPSQVAVARSTTIRQLAAYFALTSPESCYFAPAAPDPGRPSFDLCQGVRVSDSVDP